MSAPAFRAIEIESFLSPKLSHANKIRPPSTFGKPPRLEWLAIRDLVVDPDYQRDVGYNGRQNIRRIASEFNWSMFTPVAVAAAGGGRFAIVDGQHRVTAAALCGLDRVPCAIIECSRSEQAAAFKAINNNTTRLHSIQVYHAAVMAGEPEAVRIAEVCAHVGITVCRYPKKTVDMKPGETVSVRALGRAVAKFGDSIIPTLKAIRACEDNAGLLTQTIIYGACEVLADHPEWRSNQKLLAAAFDQIDLGVLYVEGASAAARMKGTSTLNQFESRLVDALEKQFKARKRA
jgi:hypothetical protein